MRQSQPATKPLPTPQPTDARHNPTADEFELWCSHPVTRWVAKAYTAGRDAQSAAWTAMLERPAPERAEDFIRAKIELQVRADAYAAFLQTTHSDYLKTNDEKEWKAAYG